MDTLDLKNNLRAWVVLYNDKKEQVAKIDLTTRKANVAVLYVEMPEGVSTMQIPVALVQECGASQYYVCCISEPNFKEVLKTIGINFKLQLDTVYVSSVSPKLEVPNE